MGDRGKGKRHGVIRYPHIIGGAVSTEGRDMLWEMSEGYDMSMSAVLRKLIHDGHKAFKVVKDYETQKDMKR